MYLLYSLLFMSLPFRAAGSCTWLGITPDTGGHVTVPTGTSMSESAYAGCLLLRSIFIPKSVTIIRRYAFSGCKFLDEVIFEEDSQLHTIEYGVFYEAIMTSITIPKTVTRLGGALFGECAFLTTVTFEAGSQLESLGEGAFFLSGLTSIVIPKSLTTMEHSGGAYGMCQ